MAYITRAQFKEIRNVIPKAFQNAALMPNIQKFYKTLLKTEDAPTAWAMTKFSAVLSYLERSGLEYPTSIRALMSELKRRQYPKWKQRALERYYRAAVKAHTSFTSLDGYAFDDEKENFPRALAYLEVRSLDGQDTLKGLQEKIEKLEHASDTITEGSTIKDVFDNYEDLLIINDEDWV